MRLWWAVVVLAVADAALLPFVRCATGRPNVAGDRVIFIGANFGDTVQVQIDLSEATVVEHNATHITTELLTTPRNDTPTAVVYSDGVRSAPFALRYTPPVITSSGVITVAAAGASVTLAGEYFGDGTRPVVVTSLGYTFTVTSVTPTSIVLEMPPAHDAGVSRLTGGFDGVHVAVGALSVMSDLRWEYTAPVLDSVTPNSGLNTAGGTVLTLRGSSFSVSPTVIAISSGYRGPCVATTSGQAHRDALLCEVIAGNDTYLTCVSPPGISAFDVNIAVLHGPYTSNHIGVAYRDLDITAVTPSEDLDTTGAIVTITGTGFGTAILNDADALATLPIGEPSGFALSVTIDDVQQLVDHSVAYTSTSLVVTLLPNVGRDRILVVATSGRVASTTVSFRPPHVSGWTLTGESITVTGHGFGSSDLLASVDGRIPVMAFGDFGTCSPEIDWSDSTVVCDVVPPGAGNVSLTVTVALQTSEEVVFSYPAAEINNVTVYNTTVEIFGFYLDPLAAVTIDDEVCTLSRVVSHELLVCETALPVEDGALLEYLTESFVVEVEEIPIASTCTNRTVTVEEPLPRGYALLAYGTIAAIVLCTAIASVGIGAMIVWHATAPVIGAAIDVNAAAELVRIVGPQRALY